MATKYRPLRAHLAAVPADVSAVTLTRAELEAVLGTARLRSWWANPAGSFDPPPQARAWRVAGWRVRRVEPGPAVTGARASPGESP